MRLTKAHFPVRTRSALELADELASLGNMTVTASGRCWAVGDLFLVSESLNPGRLIIVMKTKAGHIRVNTVEARNAARLNKYT